MVVLFIGIVLACTAVIGNFAALVIELSVFSPQRLPLNFWISFKNFKVSWNVKLIFFTPVQYSYCTLTLGTVIVTPFSCFGFVV